MAFFSNLRGGDNNGANSPATRRARQLLAFAGVWKGWGHASVGWVIGTTGWVIFLPFVAAFMVASSLARLLAVWTWARDHRSKQRTPELRMVYVAVVVSAVVPATLLALILPDIGFTLRRLPYPTVLLSLVVPCVWILANNWVVLIGKKDLGIPPLLDRLRFRETIEDTAEGVLPRTNGRPRRPLGERGLTRPNPILAFLFWMGCGSAVASSGIAPFSVPGAFVRETWAGHDAGGSEQSDDPSGSLGGGSSPGTPEGEMSPPGPPSSNEDSQAPATPPPPETAFERCGYNPERTFAEDPDVSPAIAEELVHLYYVVGGGAKEIGCPDDGVEFRSGFHVSVLTGGESRPSLLLYGGGEGAVVYDHLFRYAWRLLRREHLARVEPKKSTGLGDYQVFHLSNGSCVLAVRNRYKDEGFVVVPGIVSHAVMHVSILKHQFPEVYEKNPAESIVGRGRFGIEWSLPSGKTHKIVLSKHNAEEALQGLVDEVVDSARCPDVDAFDLVAADALRRWEEEAE